jgi:hypothetical protein
MPYDLTYPILISAAVAITVVFILPAITYRRRKNRFQNRPVRSFNEWYPVLYGDNGRDKEIVRIVHQILAKEIGVDESVIYPNDRFDKELACPEWWGLRGHELEGAELELEDYITKKRKIKIPKDAFKDAATVLDLINATDNLLANNQ